MDNETNVVCHADKMFKLNNYQMHSEDSL